jgi:hypothetical protein
MTLTVVEKPTAFGQNFLGSCQGMASAMPKKGMLSDGL